MITVKGLIEEIRIAEKDINEVKFSDWDLINAINKALRLIANRMSLRNSDFLERSVRYDDVSELMNGVDLPDDFRTIQNVISHHGHRLSPCNSGRLRHEEYIVSNGKLFAKVPVTLRYKGGEGTVDIDSTLTLPDSYLDFIVDIVQLILHNEERDILIQYIVKNIDDITPKRKYSNIKIRMPFKV